jgi:MFS family permease
MSREARETIRHYLLLRSVSAFGVSFIAAVYATFLISKGLNLFEVNLVNFFYFATLFICEVPTGAFADVFGRKLSFVISCTLFAFGMFIYCQADSFWEFVAAEIVAAVGTTFASGAFQAWLIDRLKFQEYKGLTNPIFAQEGQLRGGVTILSAIGGAYLAEKNIALPWLVGGVVMTLAAVLAAIYMKEEAEFIRKKFSFADGLRSMKETIVASAKYGATNRPVRFILVAGLAQFFAIQPANMQWQPFFGQFLPNKTSFGFLYASIAVAVIIGSAIAPWFLRKIEDEKRAIISVQLIIGAGIALTVLCRNFAPALTVYLVHEVARGMFTPLKDAYLNDNIPSKERATLLSFDSISHHIGGMIGLLISGALAEYLSLPSAWIFSGVTLIIITLLMLKNGRRK